MILYVVSLVFALELCGRDIQKREEKDSLLKTKMFFNDFSLHDSNPIKLSSILNDSSESFSSNCSTKLYENYA